VECLLHLASVTGCPKKNFRDWLRTHHFTFSSRLVGRCFSTSPCSPSPWPRVPCRGAAHADTVSQLSILPRLRIPPHPPVVRLSPPSACSLMISIPPLHKSSIPWISSSWSQTGVGGEAVGPLPALPGADFCGR
jgi:hypothetical protein